MFLFADSVIAVFRVRWPSGVTVAVSASRQGDSILPRKGSYGYELPEQEQLAALRDEPDSSVQDGIAVGDPHENRKLRVSKEGSRLC